MYGEKENVSLNAFRKEEAKLTNQLRIKRSSSRNLFGKRLDTIPRQRENKSVTLFVDIAVNMNVESKRYGPFKVNSPKLSMKCMYQIMVYTLRE